SNRSLAASFFDKRSICIVLAPGERARAALAGMSLSEYLLQDIERSLERPTRDELLKRLSGRSRVEPAEPVAAAVAAERE
ncbi:hypothetical protein, partial [Klebsiella pneumoniae]|uniref:hypothetical protein n=1 Tax=Klebsiella pneumoniae TaxID=573 RepID=UPI0025A17E8C